MQALYINSVKMISSVNNDINSNDTLFDSFMVDYKEENILSEFWKLYPTSTIIIKKEFNPFVGVGAATDNYGVSQIISGPETLPDDAQSGVGGFAQMLNIDKFINMKDLSEHLKDLSPDEIEKATAGIKSMLGNVDEDTEQMINMMLNDISIELKKRR